MSVRKAKEFVGYAFGESWEKVEGFKSEKISYSTMAAYNEGSFMSREGKWRIFFGWGCGTCDVTNGRYGWEYGDQGEFSIPEPGNECEMTSNTGCLQSRMEAGVRSW